MVIRRVLPAATIKNAVREIAAFLRADLDDSTTWYRNAPQNDGIVPMHHAQSLWDIRQSSNLYEVFSEFWGTHGQAPDFWRGLPGQLETEPGTPAVLSELGLKLIGVLPWD